LRLWGGSATFTHTEIFDNVAMDGAGVYAELYNGYASELNLSSYADVHGNDALSGSGLGGGVYMREGTVQLTDGSDIYYNDAIEGGGAYLVTSTLTIQGNQSEIMLNTATGNGGGVYATGSTINFDLDAELYNNTATGNGGGAYLNDSDLWGDKALIHYNTANGYGGGVYATNSSLLDMDLGGYACAGPRCSQLSYNTASSYGGGVYARESSEVDLRQIFVENNSAEYGGGIYAYQSPVYLYNALLARNDATGATGDGLRLFTGASLNGSHDTLAHNDADGATTGNAIDMSGASLTLDNSIVWGHTSSIDDPLQTIACSDIEGSYTGTDNLNVDPSFIDPVSGNFHLQSLSPVIDRCASGQARDFDNEPRPLIHVRPATPYDMGADEASARVGINDAGCTYGRVQDAVDAANPSDTIQAVADVFSETVNITDKNLTIEGGYDFDCVTYITNTTTVDGSDSTGSVFDITNSTVTLRDLDITGGNGTTGGGVNVLPGSSRVTLDNTDVFGNQADYGGGLYVDVGNVLTITNDSDVTDNTATIYGGGARVWGRLVGDGWSSTIAKNSAPNGGGIAVPNAGVLYFYGSHILENSATDPAGHGGGIYVYAGGVVTLTSSANVARNDAYDGAGIYADAARVHLGAVVHSNVAANNGGGVYLANDSALHANGTYVGYPAVGWGGNQAVLGAGIYAVTSTVDFEGNICNNLASSRGAGIYAVTSTITLTHSSVGGPEANQPNQLGPNGHYGAGLYLTDGTHATLGNTVVASNTFPATGTITYGGGAYVTSGSVLTLTNSRIEHHLAPSASEGRGGGIYLNYATLTLENSQVLSNTAGAAGGGVRVWGASILNVLGSSEIRNNHALNGEGGGIAVASGAPDINVSDSTLQDNTAGADGGAIYLSAGTLDLTGWWDVRWNHADGNGGAVAVNGSGNANFYADGGTSHLSVNTACTPAIAARSGWMAGMGSPSMSIPTQPPAAAAQPTSTVAHRCSRMAGYRWRLTTPPVMGAPYIWTVARPRNCSTKEAMRRRSWGTGQPAAERSMLWAVLP
jgi:hypothetical protein